MTHSRAKSVDHVVFEVYKLQFGLKSNFSKGPRFFEDRQKTQASNSQQILFSEASSGSHVESQYILSKLDLLGVAIGSGCDSALARHGEISSLMGRVWLLTSGIDQHMC